MVMRKETLPQSCGLYIVIMDTLLLRFLCPVAGIASIPSKVPWRFPQGHIMSVFFLKTGRENPVILNVFGHPFRKVIHDGRFPSS